MTDPIPPNAKRDTLRADLERVTRENDLLTGRLQGCREGVEKLRADLAACREENERLKAIIDAGRQEIERRDKREQQSIEDWRGIRAELEAARARVGQLEAALKAIIDMRGISVVNGPDHAFRMWNLANDALLAIPSATSADGGTGAGEPAPARVPTDDDIRAEKMHNEVLIEEAKEVAAAMGGGSFKCPICGVDTPHSHAPSEATDPHADHWKRLGDELIEAPDQCKRDFAACRADLERVTRERDEALHAARLMAERDTDGAEFAHVVTLKADLAAARARVGQLEAALCDARKVLSKVSENARRAGKRFSETTKGGTDPHCESDADDPKSHRQP